MNIAIGNIGFAFFLIFGIQLSAQSAISGKINLEDSAIWEQKIYLSKFNVDHLENLKYVKEIAWSPIAEDGSFSFDRKHISESDAVYRVYVRQMENAIIDTLASQAFILSERDTIQFHKNKVLFNEYTSTNLADGEWQRLQKFEKQLVRSQLTEKDDAFRLKSFAKDSLRILMVKLIGIKQLDEKQLLDQDIAQNPDYYLAILEELEQSDVPPAQYRFLEKKLAFLTQEVIEQKYAWSKIVNIVLGFLVLGLGGILVFQRKHRPALPGLSRQERNIQNLILQGKSNKEIASELFISLSTVKTHITNIYSKLKVKNRQELLQKTRN